MNVSDLMSGSLDYMIPEVKKLFGIPQHKTYHPEVDAGIHTMLAVQYGLNRRYEPIVILGALLHDVGKGETDKALLPAHHGHEVIGGSLVRKMFERESFRAWVTDFVPDIELKEIEAFCVLVAERHLAYVRYESLSTKTVLKEIMRVYSSFKDNKLNWLHRILNVVSCDKNGRLGVLYDDRGLKDYWSSVHDALMEEGLCDDPNAPFDQELHKKRLNVIDAIEFDSNDYYFRD